MTCDLVSTKTKVYFATAINFILWSAAVINSMFQYDMLEYVTATSFFLMLAVAMLGLFAIEDPDDKAVGIERYRPLMMFLLLMACGVSGIAGLTFVLEGDFTTPLFSIR